MTEDLKQDARFTDQALAGLPATAVPSALEARILADFDRVAARRAPGALSRIVDRWRDAVWPSAPVWKPATVLAASLVLGVMAGALVPAFDFASNTSTSTTSSDQQYAAGDAPPVVNMAGDL
jgi:hypothetical protein